MEKVYETFPGYCSDTYITAIRPQLHDVFGPLVPSVEDNSLYQFHTATEDTHFSIKYVNLPKSKCTRVLLDENEVVNAGVLQLHNKRVVFVVGFADANCMWAFRRSEYKTSYMGDASDPAHPVIKSCCYLPIENLHLL